MQARRGVSKGLFAFAIYLSVSLIFFARMLPGHLSDYYVGRDTDPSVYIWALQWWRYVVAHHTHPFLTKLVWAPYGFNLTWMTCFPLLGILTLPLTILAGPVATYNLISLIALPLGAFAAYLLCTRLSRSFVAAILGGFVFGFSPYMIGQLLGHMVLVLVFPIPIAVYLVVRRIEGTLSRPRFVVFLAIALSVQFFLELEPFALLVLVGSCAVLIALRTAPAAIRKRVLYLIPEMGLACALTAVLAAPYLYFFFAHGYPDHPLWPTAVYSADLLNFIVPTPANAFGASSVLRSISAKFSSNIFEQDACIGIPLIAILLLWRRRHKGEVAARVLVGTLLVVAVLSLGPFLQIGGRLLFPMPWLLLQKLPILKSTLPVRLTLFAFLALAIAFTLWLSDPLTGATEKAIGVLATLAMLVPNPAASFWVSPISMPQFFRGGTSQRLLSASDVVLPLPYGQKSMCMLWQAASGMSYRMAAGWTGFQPIEVRRWPVVDSFLDSRDLPEPELQLKAFIANLGITAVVVDASDQRVPQWKQLLSSLAVTPEEVGGILLYRIPPDAFKAYRGMNAVDLEQRAERARFETLILATDRYLAGGGDPAKLTVPTLEAAGLFPAGWTFDPKPDAWRDIRLERIGSKIGVGVIGSESGLKPILDDYGSASTQVYFPFPRAWPLQKQNFLRSLFEPVIWGSTSGESIQLMVMAFDPAQLRQLAARFSSQSSLSLATARREASH